MRRIRHARDRPGDALVAAPRRQAHSIGIGAGAGARALVTGDPLHGWSPATARGLPRLGVAVAARSRAAYVSRSSEIKSTCPPVLSLLRDVQALVTSLV